MARIGKVLLVLILMTGLFWAGACYPRSSCPGRGAKAGIRLCIKCGQAKGSASCCKPNAEECAKCGLAKGSPGCCKIAKGATEPVLLCAKCKQIKGSAACGKSCAKKCRKCSAKKCRKCGAAKGSPGVGTSKKG